MLLVQEQISEKNMAFYVSNGVYGSKDIVAKCTAAIFFPTVVSY